MDDFAQDDIDTPFSRTWAQKVLTASWSSSLRIAELNDLFSESEKLIRQEGDDLTLRTGLNKAIKERKGEHATDTEIKGHLIDQLAIVEGVNSEGLISRMTGNNVKAYEQPFDRSPDDPLTEVQLTVYKREIAATNRIGQRMTELAGLMLEREAVKQFIL
ncbi:hypothetical protein QFC22_000104 [Naganishia vaughanmartiniae]|uniref:Uncharacterized protein n=1 Tax=Naganishia vaughanmartiniae TaxID=1424756 RepID=A0ACC2XNF6_9TREE|nr:hypothetical protein QFC22_000104 [Naganishia vaughanmartiniae]